MHGVFMLRFVKEINLALTNIQEEISEATNTFIADLLEPKIIELIALYDSSLKKGEDGLARIRTGDLRLVRATS